MRTPLGFCVYLCTLVLCCSVTPRVARADFSFPLSEYNLIVFGDATSSSEVEGKAFIGGNMSGNWNVAFMPDTPIAQSDVSLRVGGSITSGSNVKVKYGSAEVGGNIVSSIVEMQDRGSLKVGGTASGNFNFGTPQEGATVDTDISAIESSLKQASTDLAALTPNSTGGLKSGTLNQYELNAAAGVTQAVFSISGSMFASSSGLADLFLNAGAAEQIVINVSGPSIDINGPNMNGDLATDKSLAAKIVWNFFEATDINLQREFNGAMLAPYAHLTMTSPIDGSAAVESLTMNGEVHMPLSTFDPPITPNGEIVPEPASLAVWGLLITMAAVFTARRRR